MAKVVDARHLREQLEQYLGIRRSLGFKLRYMATLLRAFVGFLDGNESPHISVELALRWATLPADVQPATWARRLGAVRCFAVWMSTIDPATEIPPADLLPYRYRRKSPYIYTDEEITALVRSAGELPSEKGLRASTYSALFGLLAVTGMRVSEGVGLDRKDVDFEAGTVTVRQAKFGKTRILFMHPTTIDALERYAMARDALLPAPLTEAFFVAESGTRITGCTARYTFAKISRQIGLREPIQGCRRGHGPRFRHAAAIRGQDAD